MNMITEFAIHTFLQNYDKAWMSGNIDRIKAFYVPEPVIIDELIQRSRLFFHDWVGEASNARPEQRMTTKREHVVISNDGSLATVQVCQSLVGHGHRSKTCYRDIVLTLVLVGSDMKICFESRHKITDH